MPHEVTLYEMLEHARAVPGTLVVGVEEVTFAVEADPTG